MGHFARITSIVLLTTLTSVVSLAQNAAPAPAGDRFTELANLFQNAQPANPKDVDGWFSGRCYHFNARNKPEAGLIVGEIFTVGGNEGPLFPPENKVRVLPILYPGQAPDFFDTLTPEKEDQVGQAVARDSKMVTEAVLRGGSLVSVHPQGGVDFRVRQSGPYLLMQSVALRDGQGIRSGMTLMFCYTFLKVK